MAQNLTLVPSLVYHKKDELAVIHSLRETIKECRERLKSNPDYVTMQRAQNELNKIHRRWKYGKGSK